MSLLDRIRRTQDAISAAAGDDAAALRLAASGVHVTKLTPTTLSAANRNRGNPNPVTTLAGTNRFGAGGLDVGMYEDQFKHYAGHPYAIVRTIANRIAGQPLHHARKVIGADVKRYKGLPLANKEYLPLLYKNQAASLREFTDGPILEAFRNPNPLMVQHTLVFNTIACLEVTGKGFWWMRYEDGDDDGDGVGGEPQLWYIPPQWMEPIHTNDRLFAGWRVRPNGGGEPWILSGDEVVYFYYSDISNPLEAYSPFTALAQPIMAHESIQESKRRSFLNSVQPSVAITIGQPAEASGAGAAMPIPILSRPQRKALKSILMEEYRGTLASGLPLILDGFIKDFKQLYMSPRELDFLNSGSATVQELNMGFGMNGISMGQVEGANRASSATADDHLCDNVVNPRLVMLSQVATRTMPRFFVKGGGRSDLVYWEPAKSRDAELELKERESMYDRGIINRNDWRSAKGMDPIQDGSKTLVQGGYSMSWVDVDPEPTSTDKDGPGGYVPGGDDQKPANPSPAPRPLNTTKLIAGSAAEKLGFKGVAESHDGVHKLYEDRIRAVASEVLTGLAGEYRQRVELAARRAGPGGFTKLHAVNALDAHHWEKSLHDAIAPVIKEAAIAGAAHEWILAQNHQLATKSFIPEGLRKRVEKAIEKIIGNGLFKRIVSSIMNRIRGTADKAAEKAQSIPAAVVEEVASEKSVAERAAVIGQVEGQTAVGTGQGETFATLKIMGRASGRKWWSMNDSRVRPTHEKAHGQVVYGNDKFQVGVYTCDYPGDPILPIEEKINCRCRLVVVE